MFRLAVGKDIDRVDQTQVQAGSLLWDEVGWNSHGSFLG